MANGAALSISLGLATETGPRRRNEDFVGAARPSALTARRLGHAMALADGIGGHQGGREAAETTVRGFLDGYYEQPESIGVRRAAAAVLDPLNRWLRAIGASGTLQGMGCTFTGLVLRGRSAHVLHVGDSRLYRLRDGRLRQLTQDHCHDHPDRRHILTRAMGLEDGLRLDYASHPLALNDRFLICSDGVHGPLSDRRIADLLGNGAPAEDTARALTAAALAAGGGDNTTALVVDVLTLPPADAAGLSDQLAPLPIQPLPAVGDSVDGFRLDSILSDGRYTRLYLAQDLQEDRRAVLKFPRPRAATDAAFLQTFLREAWATAQVRRPVLGQTLDLPPGRQSRLYLALPYYPGETLERRLSRAPVLGLEEGRHIGISLCRAVAALHRAGFIHRDIKPDNVILGPDGSVRLIDLGVVRTPALEDLPDAETPGTPSFMAPELFDGTPATERTDLFALAATLHRAFTGRYPYGEIEPFTRPVFGPLRRLSRDRPDLPPWLDHGLATALSPTPETRQGDVIELMMMLENGPSHSRRPEDSRLPLIARNPVRFWQGVSALLALCLLLALAAR